jgi:hypothetical protein
MAFKGNVGYTLRMSAVDLPEHALTTRQLNPFQNAMGRFYDKDSLYNLASSLVQKWLSAGLVTLDFCESSLQMDLRILQAINTRRIGFAISDISTSMEMRHFSFARFFFLSLDEEGLRD